MAKNNGQTQPPAPQEQPPAEKTVIVISDEDREILREIVKEHFAADPELKVEVPTIESVIEAGYAEDVAKKIVAEETFKAEVLAELKAEAANAPPPPPGEDPLYVAATLILFNNVEYIDGDPIKVTGEQAAQLLSVGAIRELKSKKES